MYYPFIYLFIPLDFHIKKYKNHIVFILAIFINTGMLTAQPINDNYSRLITLTVNNYLEWRAVITTTNANQSISRHSGRHRQ